MDTIDNIPVPNYDSITVVVKVDEKVYALGVGLITARSETNFTVAEWPHQNTRAWRMLVNSINCTLEDNGIVEERLAWTP